MYAVVAKHNIGSIRVLEKCGFNRVDRGSSGIMLGIRTTLDLTQVELAKKLGISKTALCEVEKSKTV